MNHSTCCPHCGHIIEPKPPQDYGLTRRQTELLAGIQAYIAEHGVAPSYREMTQTMGFSSTSRVYHLIQQLIARGRIVMRPAGHRSIKIISPLSPRSLPVAGETPDAERGSSASGHTLSSGVDEEVFA